MILTDLLRADCLKILILTIESDSESCLKTRNYEKLSFRLFGVSSFPLSFDF